MFDITVTVDTDPLLGTVVRWTSDGVELASAHRGEAQVSGNAPNHLRAQVLDAYRTLAADPAADMTHLET